MTDNAIVAYRHTEIQDGWIISDNGGFIYMSDGRVIERKPNQSIDDAINEYEYRNKNL